MGYTTLNPSSLLLLVNPFQEWHHHLRDNGGIWCLHFSLNFPYWYIIQALEYIQFKQGSKKLNRLFVWFRVHPFQEWHDTFFSNTYYITLFLQLWIIKKGHLIILLPGTLIEKNSWNLLRKSHFSTLTDLNPGVGKPLDMLAIFFFNAIFIMLQKESFSQKYFWISCTGSKVLFCHNWKIAKMALLNGSTKSWIYVS